MPSGSSPKKKMSQKALCGRGARGQAAELPPWLSAPSSRHPPCGPVTASSPSLPGHFLENPPPPFPGGGVNDLSLPTVGGQFCPLLPRTEAQASLAPQTPALRLVLCVLPLGADGGGFNVKKADLFDASTLGKSDHILPKSATGRLPFPRVVPRAPSVQPLLPHPRLSPALLHVLWLCPLSEVTLSPPPSPRAESPSPK